MAKYKTIEEIRLDQGLNQEDWAAIVSSSFRTYQGRLYGEQPNWLLIEIIKASKYNGGLIHVDTTEGSYDISIKPSK